MSNPNKDNEPWKTKEGKPITVGDMIDALSNAISLMEKEKAGQVDLQRRLQYDFWIQALEKQKNVWRGVLIRQAEERERKKKLIPSKKRRKYRVH